MADTLPPTADEQPAGAPRAKLTRRRAAFVEHYLACWNGAEAARRAGFAPASANVEGARLLADASIRAVIEQRMADLAMSANEVLARLGDQARSSLGDVVTFRKVAKATTMIKPAALVIAEIREQIAFDEEYAKRATFDDVEMQAHAAEMAELRRRILRLEMQLERDPNATAEGRGPIVNEDVPVVDLAYAAAHDKLHLIRSYNADDNKVELYSAQAALELLGKHHKLFTDKVELAGAMGLAVVTSDDLAQARTRAEQWERERLKDEAA